MENKNIQFLQKLQSLPEEVNLYFSSILIEEVSSEISKNYNIELSSLNDLIINFFVSDFNLSLFSEEAKNKNINENILDNFICDFLGKLFLPVESFLSFKVKEAIENRKGNVGKYKSYIEKFNNLIEENNLNNLADLAENFMESFDEKEEELVVLNFLERDLMSVLSDKDIAGAQRINGSLIYLLINKKDSLSKFIRAFLNNQEKASSKRILIDGKEQEPTIANWIKHFVKDSGSGMPGSIVLAKYLTSSSVIEFLNNDEKRIIKKIIKLYKNLVFFPDSMANMAMDNWEIIPVDRDSSFINETIKTKVDSKSKKEIKLKTEIKPDAESEIKEEYKEKIKEEVESRTKPKAKSVLKKDEPKIKKEFKPEIKAKPQIKEVEKSPEDLEKTKLQGMLAKYPKNSLERKAIESEIKKIDKKQIK